MWTACYNRAVTFCQQKKWAATKWKFASYVDTLAAAYAEAGDFDSAIRYGEKAIGTAGTEPEETFALATQLFSKRDAMELPTRQQRKSNRCANDSGYAWSCISNTSPTAKLHRTNGTASE
jgi:hypothetical protein